MTVMGNITYYVAIGFERPGATAASCCRILSMSNGIVVSALERLRSPDSGMAVVDLHFMVRLGRSKKGLGISREIGVALQSRMKCSS